MSTTPSGRNGPSAATARGCSRRDRPRGVALLMTLAVVLLLTIFLSEYFFASGLELRGMTTYKEAEQARTLAESVFNVVQVGLQQDEVDFFEGFAQVQELLRVAVLPWEEGLVVELEIEPLDHIYNLNQLSGLQPGKDSERVRWNLFFNVMADVKVPNSVPAAEPTSLDDLTLRELYAALYDWIDVDDEEYDQFPGVRGAEQTSYFGAEPEFETRNGKLDRLSEIRLVRGVATAGVTWEQWQERLSARPPSGESNSHWAERVNLNVASAEVILLFLEQRYMDPNQLTSGTFVDTQTAINGYVDEADAIAGLFAPDEGERTRHTKASAQQALDGLGLKNNYGMNNLFSVINQYYRIHILTEVNGVRSRLDAVLHVPRNEGTRVGTGVDVLWARYD